jgi:geranylgeranyl diphosphate synthase type II
MKARPALYLLRLFAGGARLAGATDKQLLALTQFAQLFGLAFQITDDILDVTGTDGRAGQTCRQ